VPYPYSTRTVPARARPARALGKAIGEPSPSALRGVRNSEVSVDPQPTVAADYQVVRSSADPIHCGIVGTGLGWAGLGRAGGRRAKGQSGTVSTSCCAEVLWPATECIGSASHSALHSWRRPRASGRASLKASWPPSSRFVRDGRSTALNPAQFNVCTKCRNATIRIQPAEMQHNCDTGTA
jgi:hypothetical protein